jgi:hypothetical protein
MAPAAAGPEGCTVDDFSPFEEDVFLKGTLTVRVTGRRDGRPQADRRVVVRACGFV